jgi:hypothetical protein
LGAALAAELNGGSDGSPCKAAGILAVCPFPIVKIGTILAVHALLTLLARSGWPVNLDMLSPTVVA